MSIAEMEIDREVGGQEKILWTGTPRQGIVFRSSDIFMIPFSLMWGGFALFWEATVIKSDAPFFFMLWGIPFVLAGIYIVFGRFILDAKLRANMFYGVTDQRIVIVSGMYNRNVKSMNLHTLSDISLTEKTDRSGTIAFGPVNAAYAYWSGTPWPGRTQNAPAFEMIPDAKTVYETIRQAQAKV